MEWRPTAKDIEILRLYADGKRLSKKHAAELSGLSYNTVAARINRLQGRGLQCGSPSFNAPLPGRHSLEQPLHITAAGLAYLADAR